MDPTIKDFESAIAELESIVKTLEEGDLALEKSLALFERGVQLSRFCHSRLEEAERRIEILNDRGESEAGARGAGLATTTTATVTGERRVGSPTLARGAARVEVDAALDAVPARVRPRALRRRRRDALQPARRRQAASADAGARAAEAARSPISWTRADARQRCRPRARSS